MTEKEREELKKKLTDDPVENIRAMAPYLDEAAQNRVLGLMMGVVMGMEKKAG